jgi:hypothetical protein
MSLWTAPPGDIELPRLDELPRRILAGASADDLALDFHDLVEHVPPTAQDAATGNHLGSRIDPADDFDNGDDLLYLPGAGRPRTATPSGTMAAAQELATALKDWGVKVSIELRTDAQGSWRVNRFVRNLAHHTVSRPSNGMTPCLSLCKYGRSDLSGPLCLEAGSSILTRRGFVSVEDVRIGDEVWTHRNRWRHVTATMSRTAPTVRLRAPGIDVVCSADHPWLDEGGNWVEAEQAQTLVHADGAAVHGLTVPGIDGFTATGEMARVAGAWVADGYIAKHKRKDGYKPYACFGVRKSKAEEIGKWLSAAGLDWWQTQDRGTSVVLMVKSVTLANWLVENFGEYSHGKTVPAWMLGSLEHAQMFLDGYLHGDGMDVAANTRHREYRRASTVSRNLATGLVQIGRSLGMHAYVAQRRIGRGELTIAGKQTSGREYWVVDFYEPNERRLLKYREAAHGLAVDVSTVVRDVEQTVYDITVAEDHSMLVDGIWSHNCNGYGGYDMVARIITMGYANHSGLGGPWSVPGWGTVPRDDGRPYIFGWEFEGGYPESWTGVHERMHDFMARCNGATLEWIGAPLSCSGEHKTWAPTRKIDRLNYTTESGRAKIAAVSRAPEDDFMSALSDAEQKRLLENVDKLADNNVNGQTIFGAMRDVHDRVVTRKYDRMTPETEDDQTLPGTIRYMDKRLRDVEDNVKAILAAVQALQPPA